MPHPTYWSLTFNFLGIRSSTECNFLDGGRAERSKEITRDDNSSKCPKGDGRQDPRCTMGSKMAAREGMWYLKYSVLYEVFNVLSIL